MKPIKPEIQPMTEIQMPIYLNSNIVWNPEMYSLSHYKERSIFQSNVIEYWAPVTHLALPNVLPNVYWVSSWGNTWNMRTQKPIGLSFHRKGYWQLNLSGKGPNGEYVRNCRKLHVVIMKTFCYFPGCENYSINHMDCNKTNNNLYNLEWCTESENTIHAIQHGTKQIFNNPNATVILSDEDVGNIYYMHKRDGMTFDEIHELYPQCSRILIRNICNMSCRIAWFKANGLYTRG